MDATTFVLRPSVKQKQNSLLKKNAASQRVATKQVALPPVSATQEKPTTVPGACAIPGFDTPVGIAMTRMVLPCALTDVAWSIQPAKKLAAMIATILTVFIAKTPLLMNDARFSSALAL